MTVVQPPLLNQDALRSGKLLLSVLDELATRETLGQGRQVRGGVSEYVSCGTCEIPIETTYRKEPL